LKIPLKIEFYNFYNWWFNSKIILKSTKKLFYINTKKTKSIDKTLTLSMGQREKQIVRWVKNDELEGGKVIYTLYE